jgi:hypothetical protein
VNLVQGPSVIAWIVLRSGDGCRQTRVCDWPGELERTQKPLRIVVSVVVNYLDDTVDDILRN